MVELAAAILCTSFALFIVYMTMTRQGYQRLFAPLTRSQYKFNNRVKIFRLPMSESSYLRMQRVVMACAGLFASAFCLAWVISASVRLVGNLRG